MYLVITLCILSPRKSLYDEEENNREDNYLDTKAGSRARSPRKLPTHKLLMPTYSKQDLLVPKNRPRMSACVVHGSNSSHLSSVNFLFKNTFLIITFC